MFFLAHARSGDRFRIPGWRRMCDLGIRREVFLERVEVFGLAHRQNDLAITADKEHEKKRVFSSANNDSKGKTISVFWTGSVFAENKMEEL